MRRDRRWTWLLLPGLALACALAGTAIAVLPASVETRLAGLPPALQQQLQSRERWLQSLSASERDALRARVDAWDALPAGERARLREHWLAWRALPTDRKALVRAAARNLAAMPATERDALRAEFDALPRAERRGWLLGPVLGAEWSGLEPLLMQVPADQREPLLAALHSLQPAQVHALATIAQRTPPQAREALRQALIATPAGERAAWLRDRLRQ